MSKVILSRKGFDSGYGGAPSPVFDGKLVPLPIPEAGSGVFYKDLVFPGTDRSLLQAMQSLGIVQFSECHFDPDIFPLAYGYSRPPEWGPSFGQSGASAGLLRNRNVGPGDLFLFFGWFREAIASEGNFVWVREQKDFHAVWGYLRVSAVLNQRAQIARYGYHPHAAKQYLADPSNTLFIGSERDYGVFRYSDHLVLSDRAEGNTKNCWRLPIAFKGFLKTNNFRQTGEDEESVFFTIVGRTPQELLIVDDPAISEWAEHLIGDCEVY